jgi:phospholipase/lecithinase/hemolysin
MRIIATVAICFLSLGCSAAEPSLLPTDSLTLKTGGAPFEAQFTVTLSAGGLLNVRRYGPPHVIPRDEKFHLTSANAARLLSLAADSTDFAAGCDKVVDGTAAAMEITFSGSSQSFSCAGAPKWPIGAKTATFLSALNNQLPDDLQVF